ncbi:MAG: carbon-nitrogen hydrolase [Flavobacteriales bacterium]
MKNELNVGTIQMTCQNNRHENQLKIEAKIKELADKNIDLVVLQELHDSLYFCQTEDIQQFNLAQNLPGQATQFYAQLAKENNIVIVSSLFEKRTTGLYHNTAVVFDKDGSTAGMYRKMHIPDDPGYYEKFYFTPGDLGFKPIKTSIGTLGILICWDQWYPEAARIMALKGAEVLIYPTAIGFDENDSLEEREKQLNSWKTIQKSHAIANGIPLICVNRSGVECAKNSTGKIHFWGNSFICGPQGEIIYQASEQEESAVTKIIMSQSETVRRNWPFLRDRRIDEYNEIEKIFID